MILATICVLGAGMLYNHSDAPNAAWEIDDDDNRLLRFYTTSDVAAGDELLHTIAVNIGRRAIALD